MWTVAWKNLTREKTRLTISVGGVAFAVVLILLLRGLYTGFTDQATQYIRSVDAEVWVAQAGTPGDFFHSVSLIPATTERRIEEVEGAREATPLLARSVVFNYAGKDLDFLLVGVDPAQPVAGPPEVEQGKHLPGRGEIVVDRVFARNAGIALGDRLAIGGASLRVAGVARGGNSIISQFAWANLIDVRKLLGLRDVANYFLVTGSSGVGADELAVRIDAEVAGVNALTEDEFTEKNVADLQEGFLPIVLILVVVAFAIGIAVIGLTIYTATIEKRKEYGVLKAIGFSNRRLYGIVTGQSLVAGSIGFVVGVALTFLLAALLERLLPSFVTTFAPADVALVALAAVLMSLLSSFVPIRPVARLEPAEVFRV
jgi:putative ABC transport system permease protein